MKEYKLQYDDFFVDDLTVELLRKYLGCINGITGLVQGGLKKITLMLRS